MMKGGPVAATPDEYVAGLDGWRLDLVRSLRQAVRGAASVDEVIKWGHLVYLSNGPVLLIRAEETRVLFGFWRGRLLRHIEPRLKPGGKYDMATLELREGDSAPAPAVIRHLVTEAVAMNRTDGSPADAAQAGR
jgi:hypothetical protein